jgi:hypothetical protein
VFETEGLQADVMRFMAIIAFCLIAILALVKQLDTAPVQPLTVSPPIDTPALQTVTPRPPPIETVQADEPAVAAIVTPDQQAITVIPPAPALPGQPPSVPPQTATPEPLVFQFVSEQAFLGLLLEQEVTLLAATSSGFYRLGEDFTLAPDRPGGELFEVMSDSIPQKIRRVFEVHHTVTTYLVKLPGRTRQDLKKILAGLDAQRSSGSLIIHRNGRISHET